MDENNVLICYGEECFRAFHMICLDPPIDPLLLTENDDNGNGNSNGKDKSWFCPYYTALAETVHYVGEEYSGDTADDNDGGPGRGGHRGWENGNKGNDDNENDDNSDKNIVLLQVELHPRVTKRKPVIHRLNQHRHHYLTY